MRFAVSNGMCSIGVLSGEMTQSDVDGSDMKLDYVFSGALEMYEA